MAAGKRGGGVCLRLNAQATRSYPSAAHLRRMYRIVSGVMLVAILS
jgi:hypothetical protein